MRRQRDIFEEIEQDLNKDIYNEMFLYGLTEDDAISPAEEGFMQGYLSD